VFVVAALIALIGVTQLYGSERTASEATRNAYCAEHPPTGLFSRINQQSTNCYDRYAAYQQELAGRGAANLVLAIIVLGGYGVARLGYKYLFPASRQETANKPVKSTGA
jgi:hypothetical protein